MVSGKPYISANNATRNEATRPNPPHSTDRHRPYSVVEPRRPEPRACPSGAARRHGHDPHLYRPLHHLELLSAPGFAAPPSLRCPRRAPTRPSPTAVRPGWPIRSVAIRAGTAGAAIGTTNVRQTPVMNRRPAAGDSPDPLFATPPSGPSVGTTPIANAIPSRRGSPTEVGLVMPRSRHRSGGPCQPTWLKAWPILPVAP